MKLTAIIEAAVKVVPEQLDRGYHRLGEAGSAIATIWFTPKNWVLFTLAPPIPNVMVLSIFWLGDTLDIVGETLAAIPPLIAGNVIMDSVTMDRWFRQRVMTLEEAVKLVYRVGIMQGLQNYQQAIPRPWLWANSIDRWTKIADLIERPSFRTLWKLVKKGPWKIIISLILYGIMFIRQVGVLIMLWNFAKAVEDMSARGMYFSRALKQTHPRKRMQVRIRRRVGGVPP